MGTTLFKEESLDRAIDECGGEPSNGYFLMLRDVVDERGDKFDFDAGHYTAGKAKSWGSGESYGDSLAAILAASKPHLKVVPFITVEHSSPEDVNHVSLHELWKASLGLIDICLILQMDGAAIQYAHGEEGTFPFSEPQQVLAIPEGIVRTRFAGEYLRIGKASAEIEQAVASNRLSSSAETDNLY